MQSFIDNLDETAMKAAADFAYKESLSQKTIPHSEILNVVKEELGWKWKSLSHHWQSSNKILAYCFSAPGGPIPHNLARPLMVRQPYSVAVRAPSRAVFSLAPEERGSGWEVEPSLMVKKDGMILENRFKFQTKESKKNKNQRSKYKVNSKKKVFKEDNLWIPFQHITKKK